MTEVMKVEAREDGKFNLVFTNLHHCTITKDEAIKAAVDYEFAAELLRRASR